MGFISNVLEYGFTAGSIITTAEREADRICKNIKTTVIEEDEGTKTGENFESDEDSYDFQIIFHTEWLPKEDWERMQRDEPCAPKVTENIRDVHTDIMDYPDEQSEENGRQDNYDTLIK